MCVDQKPPLYYERYGSENTQIYAQEFLTGLWWMWIRMTHAFENKNYFDTVTKYLCFQNT